MSTDSNQGPPDIDVVFRQLFSFLFKKKDRSNRDQRRIEQEQNSFKRLLDKRTNKHVKKKREPGKTATAMDNDKRPYEHMQRQRVETIAVSQPRVDAVTSKSENTITQHSTAFHRSQLRHTEPVKADKVLKQNINANSTRKWLHDSRALRQAFVLKELLEPPIALRKRPRRRYS